jgi:hydrogenase maturation protein HypF
MFRIDCRMAKSSAPLPTVLAFGAWLKNAACLLVDGEPRWSALHGDLDDPAACAALEASVGQLLALHGRSIAAVAHDLHPDFFSTQLAVEFADRLGVPAIGVQHHHAHIAAVVAEHRIEGPVIGLALDGVGLGSDGTAWGGELLWLKGSNWMRLGHLQPLGLPGGDRAAKEPWRMAASALFALGRGQEVSPRFGAAVGDSRASGVLHMLERGLNCPSTTSAGRWFDAAAGALGLCLHQSDEAQAAIALEASAQRWLAQHPPTDPPHGATIDDHNNLVLEALLPPLLDATEAQRDRVAAAFHMGLANALASWAIRAATVRGSRTVCLGGGCFFNRILRERVTTCLESEGLRVCRPIDKGCGDAGLALGQAWVAAQQLRADPLRHSLKETTPCA